MITIEDLHKMFPLVKLPLMLTPESYKHILEKSKPEMPIDQAVPFLTDNEQTEIDEFTEFAAVCRFDLSKNYFALLYLRGDLSGQVYHLLTLTNTLTIVNRMELAGTFYNEKGLSYTVAAIQPDKSVVKKSGLNAVSNNEILDMSIGEIQQFRITETGQFEKS
jgi:hypothetical protein